MDELEHNKALRALEYKHEEEIARLKRELQELGQLAREIDREGRVEISKERKFHTITGLAIGFGIGALVGAAFPGFVR